MRTLSHFVKQLGAILATTTLLFSAWAQNQATLTPIGKWPEYPLLAGSPAVRVAGSYAYVADKGHPTPLQGSTEKHILRLLVLDVSTPSQPRYLSHVDTPTYPTDRLFWFNTSMEVSGNYAYVALGDFNATGPGMLAVFSLSQAAAPQLVGTCTFVGWASDMHVVGNHAYVTAGTSLGGGQFVRQVLIINIADPTQPVIESTVRVEASPLCVSVAGNYAYVGGYVFRAGDLTARVDIIDVTNPRQAILVGGFDMPEGGQVLAVAAQGSLLHLGYSRGQAAYEVYDLLDPLTPALLARYELLPHEEPNVIRVVGNLVCLATSMGLRIMDLTIPSNPQFRAFLPHGGPSLGSHDSVDFTGQFAYWHAGGELKVLDVHDPAAPSQVGQLDTSFGGPGIATEGDLACLLEGPRLRVFNISNPHAPALVAAKDLYVQTEGPYARVHGWKMLGQRVYVLADTFLQILDLTNASQPIEVGRVSLPAEGGYGGIDVVGNRAYLTPRTGTWTGWLTVIDISNVAAPVELGSLYLPDMPGPPQVVGDFAYLQLYDTDLVAVDIRNPGQMVEAGRYHSTNRVETFQVVRQHAYVLVSASAEKSLHVVDLADPAHPRRIGRFLWEPEEPLWPEELHIQGRHAFVALNGATNRIDILDIGDPTQPVQVGAYHAARQIAGLAMVGDVLCATSDTGLTVLEFFAPNTSPNLRLNAPVLSGGVAVLTWEGGPGIKLQKSTSLTTRSWLDVPGTDGQSLIALPPTDAAAFFRLIQP